MMRVYLWQAGSADGVTDDLEKARDRVAGSLLKERAPAAVVETAWFDDGADSMGSGYVRSNEPRLTAHLRVGRVIWSDHWVPAPGAAPLRAAS